MRPRQYHDKEKLEGVSFESLRYRSYSTHPSWYFHGRPEFPGHAAIIAERLEKYPNVHIDVGARTADLTRHISAKACALFLRFPDRIIYGPDSSWKPYLRPTQRSVGAM